jgi:hypothetical protein
MTRCGELEIALRTRSDTALNWLTSNAVITWEQRTYGLQACVVAGRSQRATFLPVARIRQAALGKTDRQS